MVKPLSSKSQWDTHAQQFKLALEERPNRASTTVVFPRILELFGNLDGKSILDFGCGSGRFSHALADRGAAVVAYDASPRQLQLARESDEGRGVRYCGSLQEVQQDFFDCAICFQVLVCNPVAEANEVLRDIRARLKPNGVAAIVNTNTAVVGRQYDGGYTKMPEREVAGAPYDRHFSTSSGNFDVIDFWYSPDDLRMMFNASGLSIVCEEILVQYFVLHLVRRS